MTQQPETAAPGDAVDAVAAVPAAATTADTAPPRSSALRDVFRSGGARLMVVPVSALLGIVNTRLVIENFGQSAYAQYGLLIGIVALLPFADLGVSAAVMNAVSGADDPARDANVRKVLTTTFRVLAGSMLVLAAVALVLLFTGAWPSVLGDGLVPGSGPGVATFCLIMIAVGIPFGFGQRVLAGVGRNHVTVLVQGLQTPLVLLVLVILVATGFANGSWIAVVPYVATFLLTVYVCWLAARRIAPVVRESLRDALRVRTVRGGGVFALAWPMLIQMIALPIAMQTDRIVLSHVGTINELSQYNLAAQMFVPVWGVVNAAGVALWPIFARARAKGERADASPTRLALGFGATAGAVCLLIAVASPWLAELASGGAVRLPLLLVVAFVALMIVQAVKYPLGMYMTDARGLRHQAWWILLLLPLNVGLSLPLAVHYGAAGPVLASAVSVLICQVGANWSYVRRDLARRGLAIGK